MTVSSQWVWQQPSWPAWRWDIGALTLPIANARKAQGEALGRAKLLVPSLDRSAQSEFLMQEGLNRLRRPPEGTCAL